MRNLITRLITAATTLLGTLLLTATGALARQGTAPEIPGGLRHVGPAPGPAHEVPGGLRHVGPPVTDGGADPVVDAAVAASSGVSLTWVLALLAVTAVVAAAAGYRFRAAQVRRTVGTVGAG